MFYNMFTPCTRPETLHKRSACMYCESRRIRTTTAICTRVVHQCHLGSDDICSVTTDVGISRMFFSLLVPVSELPSPKKGFTGMMQTAAVANKHETLLIQYPA